MANVENFLAYDKDASQNVIAYSEGGDQGCLVVAPDARVAKSSQYLSYPKGNFRFTGDTTRGLGDMNVQSLKVAGGTWEPLFLIEHPLESEPFDRQIMNRDGVIAGIHETDLIQKGVKVKDALDQEWNSKVISLAAAIPNSTTPTTKWDQAGAAPGANLRVAGITFFQNCGKRPSHLMVPWIVMQFMADSARAEYGISKDIDDMMVIQRIVLRNLGIPANNLIVPGVGVYNATTAKYEEEWGDKVLMWYTKPNATKEDLTFMKTFRPKDKPAYWQYAPYETDKKTGIVMQGVTEYLVQVTCSSAGYILTDVLANY